MKKCQQLRLEAELERKRRDGDVLRLQGKLGCALLETARAQEEVKSVRSQLEDKLQAAVRDLKDLHADLQHARELKNNMARRVREAHRKEASVDDMAMELHKCRQRVRALNKQVNELKTQICQVADVSSSDLESDHEPECMNSDVEWIDSSVQSSAAATLKEAHEAMDRIKSMPQWRAIRGKGAGKGAAKYEWRARLVIYALLALMVPVSAIGMAIVMVVKFTAPWLRPTAPTYETIERCRFELRFLEEAIAARRIASAFKLRSIGFDETTKLGRASLTTSVTIEPIEGGNLQDVILRAAYCPYGGTSELVVKSIDERCCARLREFLRRWRQQFLKMFPDATWTGPDANLCSLHRLGGGGSIMSDTCNAARCAKRLLADLVGKQVQQHLGDDRWEEMTEDERECAIRVHQLDCWGHMRNIFLDHMSSALAAHVKEELQPELETFGSWERMSTEYSQLLRACYKEFYQGCRYYKGKGRPYAAWLRERHPAAFVLHLERAEGGRQVCENSDVIYAPCGLLTVTSSQCGLLTPTFTQCATLLLGSGF